MNIRHFLRQSFLYSLARSAFPAFLSCYAFGWMAVSAYATSRNWTGAINAYWSEPNNWSPAGAPQNGEVLMFGYVSDANRNMVNDIANLAITYMSFTENDYQLGGNSLSIATEIYNYDQAVLNHSSHTTTINCPLSFPNGGDILTGLQYGQVTETTTDIHLNGPIEVQSNSLGLNVSATDFQGGGNGHIYVSGVISGAGNVLASSMEQGGHVSYVEFNGALGNTFSGSLALTSQGNASTVFNVASGFVVTNRIRVDLPIGKGDPARLYLAGVNQIGPDTTIEMDAGAQLILTGNNVGAGSLVFTNYHADSQPSLLDTGSTLLGLSGGITAYVDNDHVNPTIKGRLNLIGYAHFDVSGGSQPALDIQAPIGGYGFYKTGDGALRLSNTNNFTGDVAVLGGVVQAETSTAFGQAGPTAGVHLQGGTIQLDNVSIGAEPLFVDTPSSLNVGIVADGSCSWAGPVTLNTDLVVSSVNSMEFSGTITGPGGLNSVAGGVLRLDGVGANSFTGLLQLCQGRVELAKPYGVAAAAGPLQVGPACDPSCELRWINAYQDVGANLTLYTNALVNLNNNNEDFSYVTFNGGTVDSGTNGQFAIYQPLTVNPAGVSAVINGNLGLPAGDNRVFIIGEGAADCDLLVNAVVFGNPSYFVKQGPGAMCLANANTFNAVTLLQGGTLDVETGTSLGNVGAPCVIFDGATLRLNGSGTLVQGFEIAGAGVGGGGAIQVQPFNAWTVSGDMLLDNAVTFNVGANSGLALNGALSGPGSVIKTGGGLLSFGGPSANTYAGDTQVNAGEVYLDKNDFVNAVPNNLTIGPGPAGPVTLARFGQQGGLGNPTVSVNGNSVLDLNGYNQTLTQLNLRDGGSVQTGTGALVLPGGANVLVGSLGLFGSHVGSIISGNIALPASGVVYFTVGGHAPSPPFPSGPELDVPAAIGGSSNHGLSGYMNKLGLGQMRLGGNNTFPEELDIYAGTVIAASSAALGNSLRGIYVGGGSTLALDGGISIASAYVVLDSSNSVDLASLTGANALGGTLYLSRDSSVNVNNALALNGVVNGSGNLIETGIGSLTLGGSSGNTFVGEVFVNQGTLLLNKPTAVTAVPGPLEIGTDNGGPPAVARNLNSYQIVGNIYVHSSGLYDVNNQVENTDGLLLYGNATVQSGTGYLSLKAGAGIAVTPAVNTTATINHHLHMDPGTHVVTVGSGATAPGVSDLVINAQIDQETTDAGLQKEGAGRLQLTHNNTYTGLSVINAGTMQVDGSQPQASVQVNNGTLAGSGTVGTIFLTSATATASPGAGPGILVSGTLDPSGGSGILQVELNGPNPGSGYDQLNVAGNVNLNGVSLNATLGYASSSPGDQFTIIQNDASDGVVGTFSGLPQGKTLYIGTELFQISYTGGTGNDVVLTRLVTPPRPVLSIERVVPNSVRLLWTTNDPAYALQYCTNLNSSLWTAATPAPTVLGTNFVVTNSVAGT